MGSGVSETKIVDENKKKVQLSAAKLLCYKFSHSSFSILMLRLSIYNNTACDHDTQVIIIQC